MKHSVKQLIQLTSNPFQISRVQPVQDLDVHLKHFILDTDPLKDHQERVANVDEYIVSLSDKITQLQSQVAELLEVPR